MKHRALAFSPGAIRDVADIWSLIEANDGDKRATRVTATIDAFCRRLAEVPNIGTRHPERHPGLRSTGVPGLRTVTVLFLVTASSVSVIRIGYLGRNIWANFAT